MSKKITVTLSDKAETFFNELMYSLTGKDDKPASQSECVSHALETMSDFEDATQDQLVNWLQENYNRYNAGEISGKIRKRCIGLTDTKGKKVFEGDMYYEEIEEDEGDTRLFSVVKWIKEWAMFTLLTTGEILDYEDNGVSNFDEVMRNSYIIDEDEFKTLHYKGNVLEQPGLLKKYQTV